MYDCEDNNGFVSEVYIQHMNEVLEYIEQHLTDEIVQEEISRIAVCSIDNFNRIFSYVTGQTLAEYIRKRKLTCAAVEILNSDIGILEVALKYGYTSNTTFTKAFRRQHRILPSEVRTKPGQLRLFPRYIQIPNASNLLESVTGVYNKKEETGMSMEYLGTHLECSEEEKKQCIPIMNIMIELWEIARHYGLLHLEKEITSRNEWKQYAFLVKGMELITDGIEPEYVETIMKNYLAADNKTGKDFLTNVIIMEGILGIQRGCDKRIYVEMLKSYFGSDFEMFEEKDMTSVKDVSEILNKDQPCYSSKTDLLEPYQKVSPRSIQRLLREVDFMVLSTALCGASGKTKSYFIENVTNRTASLICEILLDMKPNEKEIVEAQKVFHNIALELEKQGEIII